MKVCKFCGELCNDNLIDCPSCKMPLETSVERMSRTEITQPNIQNAQIEEGAFTPPPQMAQYNSMQELFASKNITFPSMPSAYSEPPSFNLQPEGSEIFVPAMPPQPFEMARPMEMKIPVSGQGADYINLAKELEDLKIKSALMQDVIVAMTNSGMFGQDFSNQAQEHMLTGGIGQNGVLQITGGVQPDMLNVQPLPPVQSMPFGYKEVVVESIVDDQTHNITGKTSPVKAVKQKRNSSASRREILCELAILVTLVSILFFVFPWFTVKKDISESLTSVKVSGLDILFGFLGKPENYAYYTTKVETLLKGYRGFFSSLDVVVLLMALLLLAQFILSIVSLSTKKSLKGWYMFLTGTTLFLYIVAILQITLSGYLFGLTDSLSVPFITLGIMILVKTIFMGIFYKD